MRESGWRWNADNPNSSAYGIPQALPGSKMAAAGADWRTNPATQIRWGLSYIAGRYGTPIQALAHSNAKGWYAGGGIATRPTVAGLGDVRPPGEAILPLDRGRGRRILASALEDAGGGDMGRLIAALERGRPEEITVKLGDHVLARVLRERQMLEARR
jgi:hypothetical protein